MYSLAQKRRDQTRNSNGRMEPHLATTTSSPKSSGNQAAIAYAWTPRRSRGSGSTLTAMRNSRTHAFEILSPSKIPFAPVRTTTKVKSSPRPAFRSLPTLPATTSLLCRRGRKWRLRSSRSRRTNAVTRSSSMMATLAEV
ncbi:hypothetical protein PMAYCL1PPCAC_21756 [Pristionchus mayeri]|uniref:Uncharacterized protein n=1 Tax=Pristionchus mayeri TaxID=1317129 RepID=A0AAN5CV37_9BILA|nr:hypothetical protein PMAYCL1PPCAC_21756 [Pristionchus mayeri]